MKNKSVGFIAVIVLWALVTIGLVVGNFAQHSESDKLQATIDKKEKQVDGLKKVVRSNSNLSAVKKGTNKIDTAFSIYLNYTNKTYQSRFKVLKKYMTDDTITSLTSVSAQGQTNTNKFSSSLKNSELFYSSEGQSTYLIRARTTYTFNGQSSNQVQFYKVKYSNQLGKITDVQSLGSYEDTESDTSE